MKEVIKIYIKVLETLVRERSFEALIHPVNPVLNETRSIVMLFNMHLEAAVRKSKELKWVNILGQLVSFENNDTVMFNSKFSLDGTHVSPLYVEEVLQTEIGRLI